MIIAQTKYDFKESKWFLTGGVGSTTSRLKSKGYYLGSNYFSWYYPPGLAPKLAPKVLSVWSK